MSQAQYLTLRRNLRLDKIAILADIHGNLPALEQVVADIRTRQVDAVWNLGDHVSGPLWPKETIQFLLRQDWVHISGNHDRLMSTLQPELLGLSDRYAVQRLDTIELDWLRALPAQAKIQNHFLLIHGTPSKDTSYLLETVENCRSRLAMPKEIKDRLGETKAAVIVCGHSHIPRVVELPGVLIVNPGSVGLPAYEDDAPEYHVVETGSRHAHYAILEYKSDDWVSELIAVSYNHQKAADQARRNGRPDWEIAIRTGFMNKHQDRLVAGNQVDPGS
jgi:putative phosphoesterase